MQLEVSYLEIYNETGYDLLDPKRNVTRLDDLRRVQALELEDGSVHLRNLALQPIQSVEDALNLVNLDTAGISHWVLLRFGLTQASRMPRKNYFSHRVVLLMCISQSAEDCNAAILR